MVAQGRVGSTLCFVEEGEVIVTRTQSAVDFGGSIPSPLCQLHITYCLSYQFAELSLLRLAPRAAAVSALVHTDPLEPKLKVAAWDTQAFARLLRPLCEIMERKVGGTYGSQYSTGWAGCSGPQKLR